jgi:hypothetical protein
MASNPDTRIQRSETAPNPDVKTPLPDIKTPLPDIGPIGDLGFACTCANADLDLDGDVDNDDFLIFEACFSQPAVDACAPADFDGNGVIGFADFGCFVQMIESC